jgi:hypothetical protein
MADLAKMSENSDFFAMRKSGFSDVGKPIMFDGSYDKDTKLAGSNEMGDYTAPGDGKYKFRFQGQSGEANTEVSFRMNNDKKLGSSSYFIGRQDAAVGGSISMSTTVTLKKGEKVSVMLEEGELQGGAKLWVDMLELWEEVGMKERKETRRSG